MGKMFLFVLHLIFIVVAATALGDLSLNVHQVSFSLIGSAFADILNVMFLLNIALYMTDQEEQLYLENHAIYINTRLSTLCWLLRI